MLNIQIIFSYSGSYNFFSVQIRQVPYLFPVSEVWDDFEGLGQLSAAVPLKYRAHTFIHVYHSVIQFLHLYTGII